MTLTHHSAAMRARPPRSLTTRLLDWVDGMRYARAMGAHRSVRSIRRESERHARGSQAGQIRRPNAE